MHTKNPDTIPLTKYWSLTPFDNFPCFVYGCHLENPLHTSCSHLAHWITHTHHHHSPCLPFLVFLLILANNHFLEQIRRTCYLLFHWHLIHCFRLGTSKFRGRIFSGDHVGKPNCVIHSTSTNLIALEQHLFHEMINEIHHVSHMLTCSPCLWDKILTRNLLCIWSIPFHHCHSIVDIIETLSNWPTTSHSLHQEHEAAFWSP